MRKTIKWLVCLVILFSGALGLTSCSSTTDDVTGTLKLESDFEGLSFINDGIGEVTLLSVTDGDTARFSDSAGTVTLRFYGIDTPESTGDVEKWGLAASNFTKEKLESAVSIVLEYEPASGSRTDSYGRYLGYVWYKSSEDAEYRNLNLELVQNGYSESTAVGQGKYADYFAEAQTYAKNNSLHIWSDEDDPLFSDTPTSYDVKSLLENIEDLVNMMVSVEGYISDYYDNSYITLTDYIDGEYYSITVYLHNTSAAILKNQGNRVIVVGTVQQYYGNWQISGVQYGSTVTYSSSIVTAGYYLTFGMGSNVSKPSFAFENITVTDVTNDGTTYTFTGTTYRINQESAGIVYVTFTVEITEEINIQDYIGHEISVFGFNVNGTSSSDMEISFVVNNFSELKIVS